MLGYLQLFSVVFSGFYRAGVSDHRESCLQEMRRSGSSTIGDMTRREVAFLLIGLGVGLIMAVAAIIKFVLSLSRDFAIGISWRPASVFLALPILLVLLGLILLFRNKGERISN